MDVQKRKIFWVIGCILAILVGCTNGGSSLENKWQLRQYRYTDGTVEREDSVFYNFQKKSFSAIYLLKTGHYQTYYGSYSLKGSEITIVLLPESLEDSNYGLCVGWEDGQRTFSIEQLSSSSLHLSHEGTVSMFRKY